MFRGERADVERLGCTTGPDGGWTYCSTKEGIEGNTFTVKIYMCVYESTV